MKSLRAIRVSAVFISAALALILTACGGGSATSTELSAKDDGAKLNLWVRTSQGAVAKTIVDAYNSSHKNQISITEIPNDSFQQKIGAAAGSKQLPDILVTDDIFSPNYATKGLLLDLTPALAKLSYKSSITPGMVAAGTVNGKVYALPFDVAASVMYYNEDLFQKAGLDPKSPPTTMQGVYDDAKAISALGGGVSGFYAAAACGGCMAFTSWPVIWASGATVMNDQGTKSTIDSPTAKQVYGIYNKMFREHLVPSQAASDNGATWTQAFMQGKIGIEFFDSDALSLLADNKNFKAGVAPIPGLNGGGSTFVGGDNISIPATTSNADQAWDFLSWMQTDDVQLNVIAKNHLTISRADLASNQYSATDPRLVTINQIVGKGITPYSVNFGQAYNDPNGPWYALISKVLTGTDPSAAIDSGIASLNASLSASA